MSVDSFQQTLGEVPKSASAGGSSQRVLFLPGEEVAHIVEHVKYAAASDDR